MLFYWLRPKALTFTCIRTFMSHWALHFDSRLSYLFLDSRSQENKDAKLVHPLSLEVFNLNRNWLAVETWSYYRNHSSLHFDDWLNDLDRHSRSQFYEKAKISAFMNQFGSNLLCCHGLLVCWNSCYNYITLLIFRGESTLLWWFYKEYFITLARLWTLIKTISFKLGRIPDITKLYSSIIVWVTLTFTQGHRVTRKLVYTFCCCCCYMVL